MPRGEGALTNFQNFKSPLTVESHGIGGCCARAASGHAAASRVSERLTRVRLPEFVKRCQERFVKSGRERCSRARAFTHKTAVGDSDLFCPV